MKLSLKNLMGVICFCLAFLMALSVLTQADEKRVKMKNLPKAVQQTIAEQSKGATVIELSQEKEHGQIFYEVGMKIDGHHKDVLIDANGAVVEIEEEVALDSLPSAVKSEIEKQAGRGKIVMVESITKNGQLVAYEAHIKSGKKSQEFKVDTNGQIIKE
ncbi:MAG: PepSY domain-containing protein [Acidobacteriota bacterium]